MRTLVAAFAFVLPFNLVFHMIREIPRKVKAVPGWIAALGGSAGRSRGVSGGEYALCAVRTVWRCV